MKNTYTLELVAECPADKRPDRYRMTVASGRIIPVEEILATCAIVQHTRQYQEDLGERLARELNAFVVLEGIHSGVMVRSEHGIEP